jgi:carboxylate-amine ligase
VKPFAQQVEAVLDMVAEDAAALGCEDALAGVRRILAEGTSADRQRAAFTEARRAGGDGEPLHGVVDWLAATTAG